MSVIFISFYAPIFLSLPNHFGDENLEHEGFLGVKKWVLLRQLSWLYFMLKNIRGFNDTYQQWADDDSRDLMVQLLLYRVLGYEKIKLKTNTAEFRERRKLVNELMIGNQKVFSKSWQFPLFGLYPVGFPIRLRGSNFSVEETFMTPGYECNIGQEDEKIMAGERDCVIDAGGCRGDTTLFFACQAGADGKVYSLEFVNQISKYLSETLR